MLLRKLPGISPPLAPARYPHPPQLTTALPRMVADLVCTVCRPHRRHASGGQGRDELPEARGEVQPGCAFWSRPPSRARAVITPRPVKMCILIRSFPPLTCNSPPFRSPFLYHALALLSAPSSPSFPRPPPKKRNDEAPPLSLRSLPLGQPGPGAEPLHFQGPRQDQRRPRERGQPARWRQHSGTHPIPNVLTRAWRRRVGSGGRGRRHAQVGAGLDVGVRAGRREGKCRGGQRVRLGRRGRALFRGWSPEHTMCCVRMQSDS